MPAGEPTEYIYQTFPELRFQHINVMPDIAGVVAVYIAVDASRPGCMAQGDTQEDALANLKAAQEDYDDAVSEAQNE